MASMKSEEETNHNMEQKQTGGGAEGHDGNDAELESKHVEQPAADVSSPGFSSLNPLPFSAFYQIPQTVNLYKLSNYSFGAEKEAQYEKDKTPAARFQRMEANYSKFGMRRVVEGVVLVHDHGHPHVLLLQTRNSNSPTFKLPGGRLRPNESEVDGLKRKLQRRLAPPIDPFSAGASSSSSSSSGGGGGGVRGDGSMLDASPAWEVGALLAQYWRPQFEVHTYPYCPPHVSRPKELRKVFLVLLPDKALFAVPRNMQLVAVPLFQLHENAHQFGAALAALPQLLSRFAFVAHE